MYVKDLMTVNPACRGANGSLAEAAKDMWERDCGCVPVVSEQGRVVGMITDRDICMAAYFQDKPLHQISIGEVMSGSVISCRPHDTVLQAERIMREAMVRRLPVTDEDQILQGVISLNDIALEAESERSARIPQITLDDVALTLSTICHQRGMSKVGQRFGDVSP